MKAQTTFAPSATTQDYLGSAQWIAGYVANGHVQFDQTTGCIQICSPGRGVVVQLTCRKVRDVVFTHIMLTGTGLVAEGALSTPETYSRVGFPNPVFSFPK